METEIMKILNVENDTECENKLVMLLNTDKFELIKLLIKNRHKIFYCTRLG
jgi:pre-mRNA-splicing helicase BRR2